MDIRTPLDQNLMVNQVSATERATFIRKTYFHVALAVLGFVIVEAIFLSIPALVKIGVSMTQGWTWLLVLGGFMFATSMAERWAMNSSDKGAQYGALALYVAAQAFIFIPLMYMAIAVLGQPALIMQAGIITLALFTGLSAVVFISGKDFSFLRSAITIGGFIALGLIVAGIAFGFNLGLWFSVAMVALAGASILYQTSNIVHHYRSDQYVAASLGLFGSLMLMFWYVLQILMSFSGD